MKRLAPAIALTLILCLPVEAIEDIMISDTSSPSPPPLVVVASSPVEDGSPGTERITVGVISIDMPRRHLRAGEEVMPQVSVTTLERQELFSFERRSGQPRRRLLGAVVL